MEMMQSAGVAAGVVQNAQDLQERDPQLRHRHFFWKLEHPEVGEYTSLRPNFLVSKCTYELQRAPLLGEHNEYVLKEILKMSDDEIADLVVDGVLD